MTLARDVEAILRKRAEVLARRHDSEDRATEEMAAFSITGMAIAVPLAQVTHAAPLMHVTDIPGAPPWLVGLTAVDGTLVSLLHLPLFYGFDRLGVSDITATLVVAAGGREIGLATDQLLGIEDVPLDSIVTMPVAMGAITRVARDARGRDLLLLDVHLLFSDGRLGRDRR